jgi:hypothetical protein
MALDQTWLEDEKSIYAVFAEIGVLDVVANTEIYVYLSTTGYVTSDSSLAFNPIITGKVGYSENLSLDGGVSFSAGDLEILNTNGEYDDWLDKAKYIWVNRPITLYLGDPFYIVSNLATLKTDFITIFTGLIADIDSKNINTLNFKFRDKMERLNSPLTEDKLGTYGTWAYQQNNQDTIKPIVFGEVHNIEPLLIDPSMLEYMVNKGNTESIIELRDNGVPIYTRGVLTTGATLDLANGKFVLTHPLVGQLTASVQGVKDSINLTTGALVAGTYDNNIANLIALITTQYGKSTTVLSASDLDLTNLAAFASANAQSVGILIADKENVIAICQQIADSIGAQIYFNRLGKLQILRLGDPTGSSTDVFIEDIIDGTLSISGRTEVVAASKIGYCKNWTVQSGLITGIPEQHKDMFNTEWFTKTAVDTTVQAKYKLHGDPVQKDTLLLTYLDATPEATRLRNFFKIPRTTYKFTGNSKLLSLELGQEVVLYNNRFNLGSGGTGQVVSLNPDWLSRRIEVEVLI